MSEDVNIEITTNVDSTQLDELESRLNESEIQINVSKTQVNLVTLKQGKKATTA